MAKNGKPKRVFRAPRVFIWSSFSLGVLYWMSDAVVDWRFFHRHTFVAALFSPNPHDLWMRSTCSLLVVVLVWLVGILVERLRRVRKTLLSSERDLRHLIDSLEGIVWEAEPETLRYRFVSRQAERILGYPLRLWLEKENFWEERLHAEDREKTLAQCLQAAQGERSYTLEYRMRHADGGSVWLRDLISVIREKGRIVALRGVMVDISAQRRQEERLQILSQAFAQSPSMMLLADRQGNIEYANPRFTEITGYTLAETVGRSPTAFAPEGEPIDYFEQLWGTIAAGGLWSGELCHRRKDGHSFWERATVTPVKDQQGRICHYLKLAEDITDRKQAAETIRHMSHYDQLTGLPNLALFTERLGQAIIQARANDEILSVLFLNLDRFGKINNTLGHAVGDEVLRMVADRLINTLRARDTIARLGSDTFTLQLNRLRQIEDAGKVAAKLLAALSEPFSCHEHEITLSASVGIALFPQDGRDADTLLQNADTAMRRAKINRGGNSCQHYAQAMNLRAQEAMRLEGQLRRAIKNGEFALHYQPQIDLASGRLCGAEALIRWNHPERGMVTPDAFIPLAEETGLILDIGEWVIPQACASARGWQQAGSPLKRVAVNLSARQFQSPTLIACVEQALADSGLPPSFLGLEVTETAIVQNIDQAEATLRQLKNLGIHLAIDDFGTGYASLVYLRRFPVDMIKIDRSFIADVDRNESDAAIVGAVIAMARQLGIQVLAEGVEEAAHLAFLQRHSCDEAQGFLFSPPVPADVFATELLWS